MGIHYSASNDQMHHKHQSQEKPEYDTDDFFSLLAKFYYNNDAQNISYYQSLISYHLLNQAQNSPSIRTAQTMMRMLYINIKKNKKMKMMLYMNMKKKKKKMAQMTKQ